MVIALKYATLPCLNYAYTVEPTFNDFSNSDNCCYNDRFANPRYLSHVNYFYYKEYRKSSVITTTWSETTESLGVKRKETL